VYIGGKYLNYYNIDSGLINNIEDNLETSLKNASNYYNSLDDAIINKILSMFKRNLQNAASNEDVYMSSYNNVNK
jgi:type III secretory pathway component EscV